MRSSSTGTEGGRDRRAGLGPWADRVARTVAALLAVIAVAGVTTAWLVNHSSDQQRERVAGRVPAALQAPATPLRRAPRSTDPLTTRPTRAAARAPRTIIAPMVPQHLFVPSVGVNTTVAPKPTELAHDPFLGKDVPSFGVPDDLYTTTWWSSGPEPGGRGMAIILGHTQIGGYGVFNDLYRLRPGDVVGVQRGAAVLRFAVVAVHTGISKSDPDALASVLDDHPADARLALLTCSGRFDQGYRESAENTVVFTRLVSVSRQRPPVPRRGR